MNVHDKMRVNAPDENGILADPEYVGSSKFWREFIAISNGKVVTLTGKSTLQCSTEVGWHVKETANGFSWIPEKWLAPLGSVVAVSGVGHIINLDDSKNPSSCNCTARDLLWYGHKSSCGRKAPIDVRK